MTKETFITRLKKIKEQYEELNKKHDLMVKQNPFVEDAYGVTPNWLTSIIIEHIVTLFTAVNEDAFYKTKLDECKSSYPGKSLEEIANMIGITTDHLKSNERVYVLKDLAEYFVCENWGGCISIGNDSDSDREYNFSDYGRLYDYIKEEL